MFKNAYNLGDIIPSNRYRIFEGEVVGIQRVSSLELSDYEGSKTEEEFDEYFDVYKYTLKYFDESDGLWKTYTLYDQYLRLG